jgi:hypothetical protein
MMERADLSKVYKAQHLPTSEIHWASAKWWGVFRKIFSWRRLSVQLLLRVGNVHYCRSLQIFGHFLSSGIILGSPLSCPKLFLYTITLPAVSCDAHATLYYTTLELASRVLLSSKKSAYYLTRVNILVLWVFTWFPCRTECYCNLIFACFLYRL